MRNKVIYTNRKNAMEQIRILQNKKYLVVELDGNAIKTKNDFLDAIEKLLNFPSKCEGLVSRFDDWITDLGWLDKETGICIAIYSYSDFLADDETFKSILVEDLEDDILPFWESEVVNVVKGGEPRNFVVFITE